MVLERFIQQHDFVTDSIHRYVYSVCVEYCRNGVQFNYTSSEEITAPSNFFLFPWDKAPPDSDHAECVTTLTVVPLFYP